MMSDSDPALECTRCTLLNQIEATECAACGASLTAEQHNTTASSHTAASTSFSAGGASTTDLTSALFNFGLRGPSASGDDHDRGGDRRGGRGGRNRDNNDRGDRGGSSRGRGGGGGVSGNRGGRESHQESRQQHQQQQQGSNTLQPTTGTKGTWTLQQPRSIIVSAEAGREKHESSSSAATSSTQAADSPAPPASVSKASQPRSDQTVAKSTSSNSSNTTTTSFTLPTDDTELDDLEVQAEDARQERGLFERAADGRVIHRRMPEQQATLQTKRTTAASGLAVSSPTGIASCTPREITSVGFPDYRWRTSLSNNEGSKLLVLVVAEKPSIALSIAQFLSPGGHYKTRSGKATPVHEFEAPFVTSTQMSRFRVTSVAGHVEATDFEDGYDDWQSVDPGEMFVAPIRKICEKSSVRQHLESESRYADVLILALDCDREGENICFEVMKYTVENMNAPSGRFTQPHPEPSVTYDRGSIFRSSASRIPGSVLRAKFSALTEVELKRALKLENLVPPDQLQARAVDARQEIDLRVGVAFTRFQSLYFLSRYGSSSYDDDGDQEERAALRNCRTLSYGPCQTPTLGFCVTRADQIDQFIPETYWKLEVRIAFNTGASAAASSSASSSTSSRSSILLQWGRGGSIFQREVALMFQQLLLSTPIAKVISVETQDKKRARPTPLNTVELLKIASRQLGIGPHDAMRVAEHLYLAGYISYPRTETSAYPSSFDVVSVVAMHKNHEEWGEPTRELLDRGITRNKKGVDAGDHPPITPMRCAGRHQLSGTDWRLYEYITRHFLATLAEDALQQLTTTTFQVGSKETFTTHTTQTIEPGFTVFMPWLVKDDDVPLGYQVGNNVPLSSVEIVEKQTEPPGYLTESELIGLMESYGIGTDASIPMHIKSIIDRGYVRLGGGRTIRPTLLGRVLVHGYNEIDPQLVAPQLRGSIEKELTLIVQGQSEYHDVVQHSLDIFSRKFAYFVEQVDKMEQLFTVHFQRIDGDSSQRMLGAGGAGGIAAEKEAIKTLCGKCHHWMRLHQLPAPPRLHCASCDQVYLLPSGGLIKKFLSRNCPLDGFELLLFTTQGRGNENGFSYSLCPYCYTHPPFANDPSVPALMGCNHCIHPRCKFSMAANAVTKCPEFDNCGGMLVLDPIGAPNWRLNCNNCNVVIKFGQSAYKVVVDENRCSTCKARLLEINFHKDLNPLRGGTILTACLFCNELFRSHSELVYGDTTVPQTAGGRGRGRGRGGRGRGRGGPSGPNDGDRDAGESSDRGGRGRGGRGRGRGRGRVRGEDETE